MVVRPTSMDDLRNVYLHEGKVLIRRGFLEVLTFVDNASNPMTHLIAAQAFRPTRQAVYVCWDDVNKKVHVFTGDSWGQNATWIQEWTHHTSWGNKIPVVNMCESNDLVFMAHDHPVWASRAETKYVDLITAPTTLSTLAQDGTYNIRFRHVRHHIAFLFGSGHGWQTDGTGTGGAAPEWVRVSMPYDPTKFEAYHYFRVGAQDDPVTGLHEAGDTLLVFKEHQTHEIFGQSRFNFGERLIDPLYGMLYHRLAVNVSGLLFAWTNEGPRVFGGGQPSTGVEIPLELPFPEPETLPEEGELEYGFAAYVPSERIILFVFGRRVYALTYRLQGQMKWSYWELGFDPMCAFRLPYFGSGVLEEPAGYPYNPTFANTDTNSTELTVQHSTTPVGNETLEVFIREATGGTWPASPSYTFAVSTGASDTHTLDGLAPGEEYEVAVRWRLGPYYSEDADGPDPSLWTTATGTPRGTFTTTLSVPTIDGVQWARVSASQARLRLTITPAHSGIDIEVYHNNGAADVLVHTESGPTAQFTFDHTDDATNPMSPWSDDTSQNNTAPYGLNDYKVRHVTADATGSDATALDVWGGPVFATSWPVQVGQFTATDNADGTYQLNWGSPVPDPVPSPGYYVWDDDAGGTIDTARIGGAAGANGVSAVSSGTGSFLVCVRAYDVASYGTHGVRDYGPIDAAATDTVTVT